MECFADDREAFQGFEKFFNSDYLSDVVLVVSGKKLVYFLNFISKFTDILLIELSWPELAMFFTGCSATNGMETKKY